MVGLIFFEVSGGSYGVEPIVRAAGTPWLAVAGMFIIPFTWSIPIALMTAEMCTAFPRVGGKINFVHEMFGPFVGWINGSLNAVSNVFDVATLPAMALGYAHELGAWDAPEFNNVFAGLIILLACALNVLGIELVGNTAYVFTSLVCLPFLVMVMLGMPGLARLAKEDFAMCPTRPLKFLTCLLWNTSGYDDAGATAAEIKDPGVVYPKALAISMLLITASYVLPITVGLVVEPNLSSWHDGHFTEIGSRIGGPALATAITVLGVVSSFGQLNALLCSSVREIVCMAGQTGQPVPAFLGSLHPRFKTPHITTILFSCLLVFFMNSHFTDLIAATVFFDCFSFILQFAAWIKYRCRSSHGVFGASNDEHDAYTRLHQEHLGRTFVGFWCALAASASAVGLCFATLALTIVEHGMIGLSAFGGVMVVSVMMYFLQWGPGVRTCRK